MNESFKKGFEKQAATRSELLGMANPIYMPFNGIGAAIGALSGPYSEKDQKHVNKKSISNILIPGAAGYRYGKRLTGLGISKEERPGGDEDLRHSK